MTSLAPSNIRHELSARGNDLYETPPEAVRALMAVEQLPQRLWEPACGPGSIVRVLRGAGHDVLATDLVDYDSPNQMYHGVDFLIPGLAEAFNDRRAIITNPPYKFADDFVRRALHLSDTVYMLLRLPFLESERRRDILEGGRLSRVWVFRNRLPMMHRDGWDGPKNSSATAYAWFVWTRNTESRPCEMRRLSWVAA